MLAPKIAKSKTATSPASANLIQRTRSSQVTQKSDLSRTIGNHAMARLLSRGQQQESSVEESTPVPMLGCDPSGVPVFSRGHTKPAQLPLRSETARKTRAIEKALENAAAENETDTPLPTRAENLAAIEGVRIHDDAHADRSVNLLGAHAVAIGNHILFRRGYYSPGTEAGQALIAHELAHVVHQSSTGQSYPQRSAAPEVLSPRLTRSMAEAMSSEEILQQVQLLRARLTRDPNDAGAAANLVILESVVRERGLGAPSTPAPGNRGSGESAQAPREEGRPADMGELVELLQQLPASEAGAFLKREAGIPSVASVQGRVVPTPQPPLTPEQNDRITNSLIETTVKEAFPVLAGPIASGLRGPLGGLPASATNLSVAARIIQGPAGSVPARVLQEAALAEGPSITVVTKLSSSPQVGRTLSVAVGEGAEALAAQARVSGTIYTANVPYKLIVELQRVGLVQGSTTLMGGAVGGELQFLPAAAEFVAPLFKAVSAL